VLDDAGKKNDAFSVGKTPRPTPSIPIPPLSRPRIPPHPFQDAGVACLLWTGGGSSAAARKAAAATGSGGSSLKLICVGRNMSLAVFSVQPDGRVSPITQGMRLGANLRSGDLLSAFVVGAARLVIASGEPMLRVFNVGIEEGENYVRSGTLHGGRCVTVRAGAVHR
jgi:hypothetical protein